VIQSVAQHRQRAASVGWPYSVTQLPVQLLLWAGRTEAIRETASPMGSRWRSITSGSITIIPSSLQPRQGRVTNGWIECGSSTINAFIKVTTLDVKNLLSFEKFHLDFDKGLTVLVGPNGAGKTNIVRVLDLVTKVIDWADELSQPADAVLFSYAVRVTSACNFLHTDPRPSTPARS
jgi:hypothetical protein